MNISMQSTILAYAITHVHRLGVYRLLTSGNIHIQAFTAPVNICSPGSQVLVKTRTSLTIRRYLLPTHPTRIFKHDSTSPRELYSAIKVGFRQDFWVNYPQPWV